MVTIQIPVPAGVAPMLMVFSESAKGRVAGNILDKPEDDKYL